MPSNLNPDYYGAEANQYSFCRIPKLIKENIDCGLLLTEYPYDEETLKAFWQIEGGPTGAVPRSGLTGRGNCGPTIRSCGRGCGRWTKRRCLRSVTRQKSRWLNRT